MPLRGAGLVLAHQRVIGIVAGLGHKDDRDGSVAIVFQIRVRLDQFGWISLIMENITSPCNKSDKPQAEDGRQGGGRKLLTGYMVKSLVLEDSEAHSC
jgi:hypothetical protein